MRKFSWYTTKEKDEYGRYIGAEVFGKGGPFAFSKCYEHFKPNRKGGHRHNHIKNIEQRLMLSKNEIKALRKIMKKEK